MQGNERTERRALASWRVQACAAGLCACAQVFLVGAGLAVSLCGNSAWLAGLAAVPACALAAAACRRAVVRGRPGRLCAAFLAPAYFLSAVFACASLAALAEQSLLPQARALHIAAMTAVFIALCAACGSGPVRACYVLRAALPAALVLCAAFSLPDRSLSGVFPLLGAGAGPLALAALLMAAACAPVLLLILPPQALEGRAGMDIPCAGFFARRAAVGAGAGCALLFLLCAGGTAQSLTGVWGDRLTMIAGGGAHQGISDTALLCALCVSSALLAACMLQACARAASYACPRIGERASCIGAGLLLLCVLALLAAVRPGAAICAAPLAALPALAALMAGGMRKRGGSAA